MLNSVTFQAISLFVLSLTLYLASRGSISALSHSFSRLVKSQTAHFWLLSIIFLPGTIVHEMSHFLTAMALGLKVRDIKIFPHFEENKIRLGQVTYEKKDMFRGILVGVAPFFGGVAFFLLLYYFNLFPADNWVYNLLFGYLVYTVSTTMFSSSQDLKDAIFIIPFILIMAAAWYILGINIDIAVKNERFIQGLLAILQHINLYLFIALSINIGLIVIMRGVQSLVRR